LFFHQELPYSINKIVKIQEGGLLNLAIDYKVQPKLFEENIKYFP